VTAMAPAPPADVGPLGMNTKARADELRRIPLAEIHESPHNPRTYYDPEALQQLADSLLQSGQLEPVLVRSRKSGATSSPPAIAGSAPRNSRSSRAPTAPGSGVSASCSRSCGRWTTERSSRP